LVDNLSVTVLNFYVNFSRENRERNRMPMGKIGFSFLGFFLVVSLVMTPLVRAQEVVESLPSGVINWTQGVVTAKGSGAPPRGITIPSQARLMAERAAKADALRNLLEAVKGVRVDSETTVESYTTKSDRVMTRVSGIVIGARVAQTRYLSDGAVEVTVAVNLTGELLAIMLQELPPLTQPMMPPPSLPPMVRPTTPPPKPSPGIEPEKKPLPAPPAKETKEPPPPPPPPLPPKEAKVLPPPPPPPAMETKVLTPPPAPPAKETKEPPPAAVETKVTKTPEVPAKADVQVDLKKLEYTGLIIDARKLGLRPALIPKILNEKGDLVYSTQSIEQQELIKMGLVGYAKDVNAASKNQRVTADPYVVPGLSATGEKKTDVVISNRDSQVILTTAPYTGYLKNGRVMVVYD